MSGFMKPLVLALGLSTAVFGVPATALAQSPVVARIGIDVDAFTLDPRIQRDTTAYRVTDVIFSGLVTFNDKFEPVPDLAESWEQVDANTFVFKLRADAKFSDGTPVTAEDVAYTFNSLLDPAMNSRYLQFFSAVTSVEAVDATTAKFNLSSPYAPLLSYLDLGIVSKAAAEASADFGANPVGSGPFKLESWNKGSEMKLVANPEYYGGKPRVDEIQIKLVPDNTARAQALEAGDLDIILSPLSPQDINRLSADSRFTHVSLPGVTFNYLNINTVDPVLSDVSVRKAIAQLVDQQTIVNEIYGGVDTPATSILMPNMGWVYTDAIKQPTFDVEAAQATLAAAGWTPGADGILAKDGKKLSFKLSTNSEDGARVQTIEYMQNLLQQVGMEVTLAPADYATFIADVQKGTYGVAMLSVNNIADPDRSVYLQLQSGSPLNWGKYNNPALDEAALAGRTATTLEDRAKAYQTAAQIIADEVPFYILSYVRQDSFANEKFSFFKPDARGFLRSLAAAE